MNLGESVITIFPPKISCPTYGRFNLDHKFNIHACIFIYIGCSYRYKRSQDGAERCRGGVYNKATSGGRYLIKEIKSSQTAPSSLWVERMIQKVRSFYTI